MNDNKSFDIIINIIIGFILGVIIYKGQIYSPKIRGPNSKDIINKEFEYNGKKYKFDPIVCGCLKDKYNIKNLYW